jgi:hypothetical protein
MIDSNIVNKEINKTLSPFFKLNGFSVKSGRTYWAFNDKTISVLNIKAVGNYFSEVTGWPPMSLCIMLGIFYLGKPNKYNVKISKTNKLLPKEHQCHLRSQLLKIYDQTLYTNQLKSESESDRKDIWWIDKSGDNLIEALADIKTSFLEYAVPWYFYRSSDSYDYKTEYRQGMTFDNVKMID